MNLASKIALIGIIGGVLSTSCKKEQCTEPVPEVSFLEYYQEAADTTIYHLVFKFTDCDGDIGMETTGSILDENGDVQTTNFKIDLYYYQNDQWNKHVFKSEDGLNSKIPVLGNSTVNPILDGEVEKVIDYYTIDLPTIGDFDTIMYKSRILDNAGHYSNWAESPQYIIPL